MRLLLVVLLLTVPFSGCVLEAVEDSERPTTLVLRFTVVNEGGDGGGADVGEHCSRASIQGDQARIEQSVYRELGSDRPFLIGLPELEGSWATTGTGGFVRTLPDDVDIWLNQDSVIVGRIAWLGNATHGHAEVNDDAVELPHAWTKRDTKEGWRIDAELSLGPSRVTTFDMGGPCA